MAQLTIMPAGIDNAVTPGTIVLPPLEVKPVSHPLGQIFHILHPGGTVKIEQTSELQITRARKDKLYKLEDGQAVLIASRKDAKRPAQADGVLWYDGSGIPIWLSHRLLEDFHAEAKTAALATRVRAIQSSWKDMFHYRVEELDTQGAIASQGLRPPQVGGLHAIGAHWSLYNEPATIVMPTGTGKTETMIATLVTLVKGTLLVVVPSRALRTQTIGKFKGLGLLRELGNLPHATRNPIVGLVEKMPKTEADLDIFEKCNVVVSTMSALASLDPKLLVAIADRVETLIVDEAHHIAAKTWIAFREHFEKGRVLQFTATPYRRDGKLVDGKVVFEYPLRRAQEDGYFRRINFEPIYEIDPEVGDRSIANAAIEKLKKDMTAGLDHLVMARCESIDRATTIHGIYQELAPEYNPVIVHSESKRLQDTIESFRNGESRVVVCVDMLGEGFDLPQLKIAAVHDTHKSLAVLLQFTGRFTRSAGANIGEATVIANIADQVVSSALERLYSEDADWNNLLSEFSSEASKTHSELIEFLGESEVIGDDKDERTVEISNQLLRPAFSTLAFEADSFNPKAFYKGLPKLFIVHRVWLHQASNTLYFVTRVEPALKWTRSRELHDRQWHLFVLHYDPNLKLLFLHSSDKSSEHERLTSSVGAGKLLAGDNIFRCLGNINRLIFQNVGVKKLGRRNLRFALYTGADVAEALSLTEKHGSVKSNLSGTGWENGEPVAIGCSYKGRVWERESGSIPEFIKWCTHVGAKLRDDSIDTTNIIANVLIPEELIALPDKVPLSIEWPLEILRQSEEKITLEKGGSEIPLTLLNMELTCYDVGASELKFSLSSSSETWVELSMKLDDKGYHISRVSAVSINIKAGRFDLPVESFFADWPPMVRFMDLSELDGQILIRPQNPQELEIPAERFEAWDWTGTDLMKESIWKANAERQDSIQWAAAQHYISGGFGVVFDDDGAGEAADLICLKEEDTHIRLALVHCKFTTATAAGTRIKDVVEVSSQAVRSAKWKARFRDLCTHVTGREKRLAGKEGRTRFLAGKASDLNHFVKVSRFKEIRPEVVIVQPGLSAAHLSKEQSAVLAAAFSYLKVTIGIDLDVICSV